MTADSHATLEDAAAMTILHRLVACATCRRQFDVTESPDLGRLGPGDTFSCSCGGVVTVPSGRPHDAAVAACASCGAPRQGREDACRFCSAAFTLRELDLDAICPQCFARVSRRGRFCHHCAVPITAPRRSGSPAAHRCPVCPEQDGERRPLTSRRLGEEAPVPVFECQRCAGLWLDREVFTLLVEQVQERRTALSDGGPGTRRGGAASASQVAEVAGGWTYRPCVVCGNLMNRRNYAAKSGVILDVCKNHGLWFDADELHQVLEWVRRGGATDADVRAAESVRQMREARRASWGGGMSGGTQRGWVDGGWDGGRAWWDVGLDVLVAALVRLPGAILKMDH